MKPELAEIVWMASKVTPTFIAHVFKKWQAI